MSHSPLALELYATEVIRSRLHQAAQDSLAHQLPHPVAFRPAVVARQSLANGLRALAGRLDPCVLSEPSLVVAHPR
jgi:hypothetical protein